MPVSASTSPPAPAVSVLGRELVTLQLDYVLKLAADPGRGRRKVESGSVVCLFTFCT